MGFKFLKHTIQVIKSFFFQLEIDLCFVLETFVTEDTYTNLYFILKCGESFLSVD